MPTLRPTPEQPEEGSLLWQRQAGEASEPIIGFVAHEESRPKGYKASAQREGNEAEAAAPALLAAPPAATTFDAPLAETVDKSDWQIFPRLLTKYNNLYEPFTVDACADQKGMNAMVENLWTVFIASPLKAGESRRKMGPERWPP